MAIDQFYPQTSVRTTAGTWHTCWHSAEIEYRFWNLYDPDMPRHAWGMFLSDWLRSNVGFDKVYLCRSLKALLRPPGGQTATLNQIGAQLSAGKPDRHSWWLGRQQSHLQCKCCSRILRCDGCRKPWVCGYHSTIWCPQDPRKYEMRHQEMSQNHTKTRRIIMDTSAAPTYCA